MPVRTAMARMPFSRAAVTSCVASPMSEIGEFSSTSPARRACSMASLASPPRVGAISPNAPKLEVMMQARALQLAPADARQIAGDQSQHGSSRVQAIEKRPNAGTCFVPQIGNAALINVLRGFDDLRHRGLNARVVQPRAAHHRCEDIRIEHAMHGDSFGCRLESGDLADGIHQRLAMVRPGAAHERSIDVEQN